MKASVIQNAGTDRELTEEESRERRIARLFKRAQVFSKTTDKIAGDMFCLRNQPIPKGKEMFPAEWQMQFVDLFYPYSPEGPLYLDLPGNLHDVALCERKLKALHPKKIRYTYLKAGENANDAMLRLDGQDPDQIKEDQKKLRAQKSEAHA